LRVVDGVGEGVSFSELEWLVNRRYLSGASMAELTTNPTTGKELQVA
jgi:hypothetical protein